MERRIRHFVSLLQLPDSIAIHYQDEQGSSFEAKEQTKGIIKHKRDGRLDSMAAAIILQRWLDSI
jgi:putative Holliday junction resolvase